MIFGKTKLFNIRGGVHPKENKYFSSGKNISRITIPERLFIPLQQHIGAAAKPIVRKGDIVLKGQLLASSQGMISAPVHAPTSGKILAITKYPSLHPSGIEVLTIVIESDGLDKSIEYDIPNGDPMTLSSDEIAERVSNSGIVGMGGATFPSAVKLGLHKRYPLQELIINGAECEPYLTNDDQLMQERSLEILQGVKLMIQALKIKKATIAIEDNKPLAIKAMKKANDDESGIVITSMPVRYPMGSEKHLVQTITGKETPARALTAELGVVVHNVATAYAVYRSLYHGEPLIERVLTLSGDAISKPGNYLARIGSSIEHLITFAGGFAQAPEQIISGGPMMGSEISNLKAPMVKGTSGILALIKSNKDQESMPCIRCASCVNSCPCGLLPLEMAAFTRLGNMDKVVEYGLLDCISCGSCSYVCPSKIPLVQYFNYAKGALTEKQRNEHKMKEIKRLVEARSKRMEKIAEEKRIMMEKRKAEMAARKKAQQEQEQKTEADLL